MDKGILRKRVFILEPARYEIRCDLCDGINITWSEYEHLIWCYDCQEDTAGTRGIFDGPIPLKAVELIGLSLDMIDLKTGQRFTPVVNEDTHNLTMKDVIALASAQTAALRECQGKCDKAMEVLNWLVHLHHDVGPQDAEWKDALDSAVATLVEVEAE